MKKILFGAISAAAISSASAATLNFNLEAGNPTAGGFSGDVVQVLSDGLGNVFTLAVVEGNAFQGGSLNTAADQGNTFVFTGPPAGGGVGILQLFAGDATDPMNRVNPLQFTLTSLDAGNNVFNGTPGDTSDDLDVSTITGSLGGGPDVFSVAPAPDGNPNTFQTLTAGGGLIDTITITQGAQSNNVNRFDNFIIETVDPIPEPSSALLLGAAGLFGLARRRR